MEGKENKQNTDPIQDKLNLELNRIHTAYADSVSEYRIGEEQEAILDEYILKVQMYLDEIKNDDKMKLEIETEYMRKLLSGKPLT